MKHKFLLILLIITNLTAFAQLMQFQQGKKYFMEDDYVKAMEYFNQAIAQERSGNKELLTEAYYLRGLTWIRLHGEAYASDNIQEQKRYSDAMLSAFRDFKSSLANDNGQFTRQIDIEMKSLHHPLLQEGLKSLNDYNDLVYNGKTDQKLLARAEDYLSAAHEIRDTYLVNDLLGQVALDKGKKEDAVRFFRQAIALYTGHLPDEPDFLMAYVYYRLAALHKTDSIRIAMQETEAGIKLMKEEHARFEELREQIGPKRARQMQEEYELGLTDLENMKMDLYLSDPALYVEAVHAFEQKLNETPDNINLLIGYASLLERSDEPKAIKTYEKVIAIDSGQVIALFNLGALHYGNGKESLELAQKTTDDQQFAILMEDAIASFELARPFFERVMTLEPGSLDSIRALKTIAFVTDDRTAYDYYDTLEKQAVEKQK
jgi:tetratricopeptide (TPR) repeat protein